MSYVIVGIHGLANKPPAKELEKWWRQAILEGLARNCGNTEQMVEFTIVYWANQFHDPLQDPRKMEEPYVKAEGSDPLKTYKDGWCDDVVAGVLGIGGLALDATKRYLGIGELADRVLQAKLNDLSNYYENRKVREKLRSGLETKLKSLKGKRIMLIAHSMGSIIAYDVLRIIGRKDPNYRLDHFVTIGSPLGLPHVKDRIYRENHLVRTPTVVRKWTNFAERRDPVAIDVHLANDYEPNDHGVQVKDDLIINGYVGKGGEPNYHKSYGYLRAPELSKAIRNFI
jgi:hypothetical protein